MNVTLRKAAALARQLSSEAAGRAQKLKAGSAFPLSVYSDTPIAGAIGERRSRDDAALAEVFAAQAAVQQIRSALGRANSESGVGDLLAEKARLEAENGLLSAILTNLQEQDVAALEAEKAKLSNATDMTRFVHGHLTVHAWTLADYSRFADQRTSNARRLADIADALVEKNISHTISLTPETVATCRVFGLI